MNSSRYSPRTWLHGNAVQKTSKLQQQRQQHHHRQQQAKLQAGASCDANGGSGRGMGSASDDVPVAGGAEGGVEGAAAAKATRWAVDCQLTVQGLECDAVEVQCKGAWANCESCSTISGLFDPL